MSRGSCCGRCGPPHPPRSVRAGPQPGHFSTEPLPRRDPAGSRMEQEGTKAQRNSSAPAPSGTRPAGGWHALFNFTPVSAVHDRGDR